MVSPNQIGKHAPQTTLPTSSGICTSWVSGAPKALVPGREVCTQVLSSGLEEQLNGSLRSSNARVSLVFSGHKLVQRKRESKGGRRLPDSPRIDPTLPTCVPDPYLADVHALMCRFFVRSRCRLHDSHGIFNKVLFAMFTAEMNLIPLKLSRILWLSVHAQSTNIALRNRMIFYTVNLICRLELG